MELKSISCNYFLSVGCGVCAVTRWDGNVLYFLKKERRKKKLEAIILKRIVYLSVSAIVFV